MLRRDKICHEGKEEQESVRSKNILWPFCIRMMAHMDKLQSVHVLKALCAF